MQVLPEVKEPPKKAKDTLLIIEDSVSYRQLLSQYLRSNGYSVHEVSSLSSARRALQLLKPSSVILDLGLEDGDGFDLLPELRGKHINTLVLSARTEPVDRVLSFELGASDYMAKPAELRELLLRLRRFDQLNNGQNDSFVIPVGGIELDIENRQVIREGKRFPRLSKSEFSLLRLLMDRSPSVVEKLEISKTVLSRRVPGESRAMDVLVSKVRRKIDLENRPSLIHNVRGIGYVFMPPEQ